MSVPLGQVLTVNQVRTNIKQLREAALYQRAEIHFGERGTDEVVLLSAKVLAALKVQARDGAAVPTVDPAHPQPGFVNAILAGGTFAGPADLSERVDDYLATEWHSGET